jgi:ABC-type Fe3+/spermidine/putrescine transport system ATPase subunit
VIQPQVLLLDEPLSNLDAKLREEMRVELRQIQQQVGITTVFVTHDQEEALTLSDQVAVMNQGRIVQQGAPAEIYERPAHSFVAGFIGQANLFWAHVVGAENGLLRIHADVGLDVFARPEHESPPGSRVLAVVKQTRVRVRPTTHSAGPNSYPATLEFVNYLGPTIQYYCRVGQARLVASLPNDAGTEILRPGAQVTVTWRPEDCLVLSE